MNLNDTQAQFNFLRALDISNINAEILSFHPSTHKFWEDENMKKEFIEFLGVFAKIKKNYNKLTTIEQQSKLQII